MRPSLNLIFVEIEGGVNLGLICRLAENFEVDTIRLVNPQLSDEDYDLADVFASRAAYRLETLELYQSLNDAIRDLDVVFGTSGVISASFPWRHAIGPVEFAQIFENLNIKNCGIVFGRESTGLNIEEIEKLDFIVRIPTSSKYPSLNLAASVAIILSWIFNIRQPMVKKKVDPEFLRLISSYTYKISKNLLKKDVLAKNISHALKKAVILSGMSSHDIKTLITLLRRIYSKTTAEFKG